MITVTLQDGDTTEVSKINADVVFTKPFGIFLINTKTQKELMFFHSLWRFVETGDYESGKRYAKFTVKVNDETYRASVVKLDDSGVLTLTLTNENQVIWSKMFSPSTYQYLIKTPL